MRSVSSRFLLPRLLIPVVAMAALAALGEPLTPRESVSLAQVARVQAPMQAAPVNEAIESMEDSVCELKAVRLRMALTMPAFSI